MLMIPRIAPTIALQIAKQMKNFVLDLLIPMDVQKLHHSQRVPTAHKIQKYKQPHIIHQTYKFGEVIYIAQLFSQIGES